MDSKTGLGTAGIGSAKRTLAKSIYSGADAGLTAREP